MKSGIGRALHLLIFKLQEEPAIASCCPQARESP